MQSARRELRELISGASFPLANEFLVHTWGFESCAAGKRQPCVSAFTTWQLHMCAARHAGARTQSPCMSGTSAARGSQHWSMLMARHSQLSFQGQPGD